MNIFDIGIILMLIGYIIGGWKEGVVKEGVGFVGSLLVFIISYSLKGIVGNILCNICPFFGLGGLVSLNILIYQVIAFFIVFSLLSILYRILVKLSEKIQKGINATIILTIPSKILGAVIGLFRGVLVVFIILICLVLPCREVKEFKSSNLVNKILFETPILSKGTDNFVIAVKEIYDVSSKTSMKEISKNDSNLRYLDIMLKYKIVSKKEVKNLVDKDKLEKVQNIDSVLNKY